MRHILERNTIDPEGAIESSVKFGAAAASRTPTATMNARLQASEFGVRDTTFRIEELADGKGCYFNEKLFQEKHPKVTEQLNQRFELLSVS